MITVYRLIKQKWATHAFDGEGAKLYGGRWNSKGRSCIYTAGAESLAILEVLVHITKQDVLTHYQLFELTLPETSILKINSNDIPDSWRDNPAPPQTADIGDQWLDQQASLALAVPSTIVPREWNYLLNPNHPEFNQLVKQARQLNFSFDQRLAGR